MRGRRAILLLSAAAAIGAGVGTWRTLQHSSGAAVSEQIVSHGRFEHLVVYSPQGAARAFVLLLSGVEGWTAGMSNLANRLAQRGAMVAGIDTAQLSANFDADPAACVFPDGDLENVSHFVQAYAHLPTYLPPILAGQADGAALAYASLAQAPAGTFAGGVSIEFCPELALRKPLCKSSALDYRTPTQGGVELLPAKNLRDPWVVVQAAASPPACGSTVARDFAAEIPQARYVTGTEPDAAFETLMAHSVPPSANGAPAALADLPLVDVPAQTAAAPSDTFAIMFSGDGGWAGLDKEVAAALSAEGIVVIGLDSLRYFWSSRDPQGLAADLDRMIRYYSASLGKRHVVLIGYSQGADVLPFAVNRLTETARAKVILAAIMGMSEHALFEFHVASWISDNNSGPATLPEVDRIQGIPILCIYGEEENDPLCPKLDPHKATIVKLKGGHHFDGNYDGLARTILASARH